MNKPKPPTMTYEDIERDVIARGRVPRDLLGHDGHYDRWHRRNGLPSKDGKGVHKGSSQEFYKRYQDDPDGADSAPPYADLWQFLLKAGEAVAWTDKPGHRIKTVPICSAMFQQPPDLTDEQVLEGRRRLEENAGGPIPDDMWRQFERDIRKGPAAARSCLGELGTILVRHGERHPEFGYMLRVTLQVDC